MDKKHEFLKQKFGNLILEAHDFRGDETVVINRETLIELCEFIKTDTEFQMNVLMDLTAVDGRDMKWKPRYEVVCHFYSTTHNHRLRVKVRIEEKDLKMPTLSQLWPAANWFEREVWDMFGITFENHPNMKRILMYEEFEGHPLRKDYPYNKRQPLVGPKK